MTRPPAAGARGTGARDVVVLVSHGFQQDYERGFANGLAENGVAVRLIGSDRTDPARLHPSIALLNLRGSQEERRPAWKKALNLALYHVRLMWHVIATRPATVHVNGLLSHPAALGLVENRCLKACARRLVLTVHNLLPHNAHTPRNEKIHRALYAVPDALMVHTERMKRELVERFGVPESRVVVVEHGIDGYNRSPAVASPSSGVDQEDAVRVLFFGTVSPYKGLDLLIDAFGELDGRFELTAVGMCRDADYAAGLRGSIASNPNQERMSWTDAFVTDDEMAAAFRAADVLVLPYRHIDQSGVVFQALRFGVPVIATDVGSLAHYVTPEVGLIVPEARPSVLADALRRFAVERGAYQPSRIRQIGKTFLWRSTIAPLLPLYRAAGVAIASSARAQDRDCESAA